MALRSGRILGQRARKGDAVTVEIKGLDKTVRKLERSGQDLTKVVGGALVEIAEDIIGRSKEEFVPVDLGALRASGHVQLPTRTAGGVEVQAGFGGPSAPYALPVHEIPPPPQTSEGGRSATHVVGQWKYLETPAAEELPNMPGRVRDAVRQFLEG